MSMGSFNSSGAQAPMAEINTTPLVDVMLVLLIIFIITAPFAIADAFRQCGFAASLKCAG
jgi:biopolymer transport protein ExbD